MYGLQFHFVREIVMKVVKVDLPVDCRVICVSDIHGNCREFKSLLEKCNYNKDNDYLFILGDILEKGKTNLETLNFVTGLCLSSKVICIKGNNDTMCDRMAFHDGRERFFERIKYRPHNTFTEMGKSIGIDDFEADFEEKRKKVIEAFGKELEFMKNLPLAIETEDFIFVHAGIENRADWENTSEKFALTQPWYLRMEHCSPKTVVCGHYPTYNFRRAGNTCLPIIDNKKRIIDIDGGASTKCASQLNALIINYRGGKYELETVFVPFGEKRRVVRQVVSDSQYSYVDWENHTLSVIDRQKDFLYAEIDQTGERGLIAEANTGSWDGKLHGWSHLGVFLSARSGESFYVNRETEDYCFGILENGQAGYLPKDSIR